MQPKNRKTSPQQQEQRFLPRKTSPQQQEQRKALLDLAAARLVKKIVTLLLTTQKCWRAFFRLSLMN